MRRRCAFVLSDSLDYGANGTACLRRLVFLALVAEEVDDKSVVPSRALITKSETQVEVPHDATSPCLGPVTVKRARSLRGILGHSFANFDPSLRVDVVGILSHGERRQPSKRSTSRSSSRPAPCRPRTKPASQTIPQLY